MTLLMTLIRPEGIWQSADNRLTRAGAIADDAAPKQLTIQCPPLPGGPQVLLGFSGLAETPDGTPMLQWIRETIRGESRFIMPLLDHLRDRLTRDIGRSHLGRHVLVVGGGIFQADGKRFYFELNNVDPNTWRGRRTFGKRIIEILQPEFFAVGSGARVITRADIDLISKETNARPASWTEHLGLLATLNRRVAERDRKLDPKGVGTVSPWCRATYLAAGEDGAHCQIFTEPGDPPQEIDIEHVLAGIDLTDSMRVFMARAQGANVTDKDMDEATRRGLVGRP